MIWKYVKILDKWNWGSLEKLLILYLKQEMDKMSLEYLVTPEGEVALEDTGIVSKGHQNQPD